MPLNATNKLAYVSDLAADPNYATDIDGQGTTNYGYDEIGNLVSDASEQIAKIDWYASGKIRSIERTSTSVKPDLEFIYDATGNRVVKIVKPRNGSGVRSQLHWTYTFYVRDAQGNVLAVYEKTFTQVSGSTYNDQTSLEELDIYGSKRLGLLYDGSSYSRTFTDASFVDANGALFTPTYSSHSGTTPCTGSCVNSYQRKLGQKAYEVTNHLGNVLETVSDRKLVVDDYSYAAWTSGTKYAYDAVRNTYYESASGTFQRVTASSDNKADYYRADVRSYSDYYAFGAQMDGRFGGSYRYDFNGKETDPESDLQDYGMRIYNARLGKFLSVDPIASKYPELTPYQFASNTPIGAIDLDGLEKYWTADGHLLGQIGKSNETRIVNVANVEKVSFYIIWANNPNFVADIPYTAMRANQLSMTSAQYELLNSGPTQYSWSPSLSSTNNNFQPQVLNTTTVCPTCPTPVDNSTENSSTGDWSAAASKTLAVSGVTASAIEVTPGTFRLTNGLYNGSAASLKYYASGWSGGSRALITTYSLSKFGRYTGIIGVGIGTGIDIYGVRNYYKYGENSPDHFVVHPAKAGLNFGMGVFGFVNPVAGGLYFGVDAFYPGGWKGYANDYDRLERENREIVPNFILAPYGSMKQ